MRRTLLAMGAAIAIGVGVAACGGTGAGAGGASPTLTNQADLQDLQVSLQANTTTLAADGLTPVDLTAIVTDRASGVAIKDKTVSFAANDPRSAVRLEVTQAVTDSSGVATARLFLNGDASAREVRVLASVDQRTPSELPIQVAAGAPSGGAINNTRGELTVRLGTDNKIEDLTSQLSYRKSYVAIVSDNSGIPRPNATVSATLRAKRYFVGYWALAGTTGWGTVYLTPAGVPSEDVSNFGRCDPGEDVNNDKVLTPGNVASLLVKGQTDANGLVVIDIVYPKNYARWVDVELEVTAVVGGSEGANAVLFRLPILASDVTDNNVAPPNTTRTRGSLSTSTVAYPPGSGEETTAPADTDTVAGSPFPFLSATPTCP